MTDLEDFDTFIDRADGDGNDTPAAGRGDESGAQSITDSDRTDREPTFEELSVDVDSPQDGIGVIAVSEGLVVHEDREESHLRAYITAPNRPDVRLGAYLLVPYPDGERLFCKVAALEYEQEFHTDDATEIQARRAMRQSAIDELDYKLLATLEPIAILSGTAGEISRRMTDRVPKPESLVRAATDAEEIKTGLDIPGSGVFIGHLAVGGERIETAAEPPTIDYRLADEYDAGDPLVFRHTLIAGGTGSGKTHVAKNVLRQYLASDRRYPVETGADRSVRPAIVQFDPQDEYAQMHDDNPEATDADYRRWERAGIHAGGHDDTIALIPAIDGASYAAGHHRAEQVAFTIPFRMVRANRWLIAGGTLNENQYRALELLLERFFAEHEPGTYAEFLEFLDDPARREALDTAGTVHEATYDAVHRRVRGFDRVFDQDAPPITDLIHRLVRPGGLTVVPTYHITDSRMSSVVVLALASLLIDQKLANSPTFERIKETPLIVGMDEAHNFLSDADTVQASRVIRTFTEAAKQGRKERLGLFLITQDPQDIADPVFKQINTKIVLNLGDEEAISAVNIPTAFRNRVPYMEQGQMVVHSPDNSEPVELLGLPTCVTRHGRT